MKKRIISATVLSVIAIGLAFHLKYLDHFHADAWWCSVACVVELVISFLCAFASIGIIFQIFMQALEG